MGWQTTKPSLPSGSKWLSGGSTRHNANNFSYTISMNYARLAENKLAIQVIVNKEWWNPDRPPNYIVFFTAGNYAYGAGSTGATKYWVGTASNGASTAVTVLHSSVNTGSDLHQMARFQFSAPDYITTYKIKYSANGGAGAPGEQTKKYGTNITLSSTRPNRTGYTFKGWATSSTATTAAYQPGASFSTNANTTLYAVWEANKFDVTYDGNGATGGSTAAHQKVYGTELTLKENGFTYPNHTFLHWNTAADGTGTSYDAGAKYSSNAALALYAIWKTNNIPAYVNVNDKIQQVEKIYMLIDGHVVECTAYVYIDGKIYELT